MCDRSTIAFVAVGCLQRDQQQGQPRALAEPAVAVTARHLLRVRELSLHATCRCRTDGCWVQWCELPALQLQQRDLPLSICSGVCLRIAVRVVDRCFATRVVCSLCAGHAKHCPHGTLCGRAQLCKPTRRYSGNTAQTANL